MRPEVEIVIPVQGESKQLDITVASIQKYCKNYKLTIFKDPKVNVSEARQEAMDNVVKSNIICFMDYDSEMTEYNILDRLYEALQMPDAGAAFGPEWWGTEKKPDVQDVAHEVRRGPAACMMLDTKRIPKKVKWNEYIGLRSGWLGGDFEEVEYCEQLKEAGFKLYNAATQFHHTGGKTTQEKFGHSDRMQAILIMRTLIAYKFMWAPDDPDWFKGIKYVKARDDDDTMLAKGKKLRNCYKEVVARNGLRDLVSFREWDLT